MTRDQLGQYRDRLRTIATRLGVTVAGLEEQTRTPTGGEAAGGISNAPLHLADVGSEAYNQELGATLLENEVYIRNEVLAALERVDRGTYGRCENCGRDIVSERLEALPYVRHCTRCASDLQAGRRVNLNDGRPANWLGEPGHEGMNQTGAVDRAIGKNLGSERGDVHAAGTPGGGTARGGLAGTNVGGGAPKGAKLEDAMARGDADTEADPDEEDAPEAFAGRSGGAVGGTPANKRAKGGKTNGKTADPTRRPRASSAAPKKTRKKKSG
jgi:RNA polymerase-binding transcription factor DksA